MAASPAVPAAAAGAEDHADAFLAFGPGSMVQTGGGTFNRLNVHHGHLRFDFALSALPENALTQLGDILRAADTLADPYEALKAELTRQFSPNVHDQLNMLVYTPELGGQER